MAKIILFALMTCIGLQGIHAREGLLCNRGDGTGSKELKIGNQKGDACVNACIAKRRTNGAINGVTMLASGAGGCWCEVNMKGRNSNSIYTSCYLPVCDFQLGDGTGTKEVKIGTQRGRQCIDACIDKRRTDSSINGVTMLSSGAGGCWCEKNMSGRNTNRSYKSCYLPDKSTTTTGQANVDSACVAEKKATYLRWYNNGISRCSRLKYSRRAGCISRQKYYHKNRMSNVEKQC